MQLYIGGIRENTQEKEVFDYFSNYGPVESVKLYSTYGFLIVDGETGDRILAEKHSIGGEPVVVELARGRRMDRGPVFASGPRYMGPGRTPLHTRPFRLILEGLPQDVEWSELRSFVLMSKARPEYMKILQSGDALLEFGYKQERDWAIERLNNQQFYDKTITARLGRRKTDDRKGLEERRSLAREEPQEETMG
ncbi:serine/arginine-rich splicing factor 4/5/6 [Nematocida homosporus]|uniref:serine/arginine-rich splicing factor 4/5/6 n=1 Tax=Nematocida homosporus TaxID=1912981 RepID=UPI00221E5A85|nr:serine/arginine-rich splicing factor 4/5/6 [Nematocida homosporus]KAI5184973.1 serine/arginine-rich splicing factor 4/5/6 [Nematocida homosporus]